MEINSMILSAKHWFLTLEHPYQAIIIIAALFAALLIGLSTRDILKESKN